MSLGAKVKQLREAKHWTQGQLSEYSGVTRSYISVIEGSTEIKRPGSEIIVKLAKALDVDEDVLLKAAGIKDVPAPVSDEPAYMVAFSNDPNISAEAKEIIAGIVKDQYAKARRNAEDLKSIPEGKRPPKPSA